VGARGDPHVAAGLVAVPDRHGERGPVLPFDRDHADVHTGEKGLPFVFAHPQVHCPEGTDSAVECSRRTSLSGASDHAHAPWMVSVRTRTTMSSLSLLRWRRSRRT